MPRPRPLLGWVYRAVFNFQNVPRPKSKLCLTVNPDLGL